MVVRSRPLTKMTFDSLNKGMQVVMHEGKEKFMACPSRWVFRL
jgi:hypothetical protein